MISIIFEIAKWTVRRISQPSSVASLSAVLAYFGIQSADMVSENVLNILVSTFALFAIFKDDKSDKDWSMEKSQTVRLVDVFLIGPYLIFISQKKGLNNIDKQFLLVTGIATIFYNLSNYLERREVKGNFWWNY